ELHGLARDRPEVILVLHQIIVFAIGRDAPPPRARFAPFDLVEAIAVQPLARAVVIGGIIHGLRPVQRQQSMQRDIRPQIRPALRAAGEQAHAPRPVGNRAEIQPRDGNPRRRETERGADDETSKEFQKEAQHVPPPPSLRAGSSPASGGGKLRAAFPPPQAGEGDRRRRWRGAVSSDRLIPALIIPRRRLIAEPRTVSAIAALPWRRLVVGRPEQPIQKRPPTIFR